MIKMSKLQYLAMDTVTDILTEGMKRDVVKARVYLADLTEEQEREVTDMVRLILLSFLNFTDDQTMLEILERH